MEAMVLTRELPVGDRGGAARARRAIQMLRVGGCKVHLLSLVASGQGVSQVDALRDSCETICGITTETQPAWSVFASIFHSKERAAHDGTNLAMTAKVRETLQRVGIVWSSDAIFHEMLCPLWTRASESTRTRPTYVLDLGSLRSEQMILEASARWGLAGWSRRTEAAELRSIETAAAGAADLTVVESHIALQTLAARAHAARIWVVANGVEPRDAPSEEACTRIPDSIVFLGDPAIDAHARSVNWLAREVLPVVRATRDRTVLHVCCRSVPSSIANLSQTPGVEIHDTSRDGAGLFAVIRQCAVGVASQRDARGAADAVLNAMAIGRPVIATSTVIGTLPGEAALGPTRADKGGEIAESILGFLRNRNAAHKAAVKARDLTMAAASADAQWRRIGAVIAEAAAGRSIGNLQSDKPAPARAAASRQPVYSIEHP